MGRISVRGDAFFILSGRPRMSEIAGYIDATPAVLLVHLVFRQWMSIVFLRKDWSIIAIVSFGKKCNALAVYCEWEARGAVVEAEAMLMDRDTIILERSSLEPLSHAKSGKRNEFCAKREGCGVENLGIKKSWLA